MSQRQPPTQFIGITAILCLSALSYFNVGGYLTWGMLTAVIGYYFGTLHLVFRERREQEQSDDD